MGSFLALKKRELLRRRTLARWPAKVVSERGPEGPGDPHGPRETISPTTALTQPKFPRRHGSAHSGIVRRLHKTNRALGSGLEFLSAYPTQPVDPWAKVHPLDPPQNTRAGCVIRIIRRLPESFSEDPLADVLGVEIIGIKFPLVYSFTAFAMFLQITWAIPKLSRGRGDCSIPSRCKCPLVHRTPPPGHRPA